jgi:hypothetical protein
MPSKNKNRIRILFLAANPRDTQRLDLDREVARIRGRLSDSRLRDRFDFQQEWAVRLDELSRFLLDYNPHVVHFSGHGSTTGELVFEDAAGTGSESASQGAIANLFRILKDDIRLVVLNACFSDEQARAIAEHIDCVIGTSAAIDDGAAIAFAGGLYRAVGFNRDVNTAFELGRNAIEMEYGVPALGHDEHLIPQLVTREGIDPKNITLFSNAKKHRASNRAKKLGTSKRTTVSLLKQANLLNSKIGTITGAQDTRPVVDAKIDILSGARVKDSEIREIIGASRSRPTPRRTR